MRIIHLSDLHFTNQQRTLELKRNGWEQYAADAAKILTGWGSGQISDEYQDWQNAPQKKSTLVNFLADPLNKATLNSNVVVITGDLTDSGDSEDYDIAVDFIQKLGTAGYSVYSVPGNHDYYNEGNKFMGDDGGSKRTSFAQRISAKMPCISTTFGDYPYYAKLGNTLLILVNSMQADTNGDRAQGKVGSGQLQGLQSLVDGAQNDRATTGLKVVVCLHHSPFFECADGHLEDAPDFLRVVTKKVDALLMGHTGTLQGFYPEQELAHGISLINSENLEHMGCIGVPDTLLNSGRIGKVTIIDPDSSRIEVYSTDSLQAVTKKGNPKRAWRITPRPDQPTVVYNGQDDQQVVQFWGGDKVTMIIGGGVQTRGSGDTWKRYVNPLDKDGNAEQKYYFGTIHIPGIQKMAADNSPIFEPIRGQVSKYGQFDPAMPDRCVLKFEIPNLSYVYDLPYLRLGYEDDDYVGNCYDDHDQGTKDQCGYLEAAYVLIDIERPDEPPPVVEVPSAKIDFTVDEPFVSAHGGIAYTVHCSAMTWHVSDNVSHPISFRWIFDSGKPYDTVGHIDQDLSLGGPNGPFNCEHTVEVIATCGTVTARDKIMITLPSPWAQIYYEIGTPHIVNRPVRSENKKNAGPKLDLDIVSALVYPVSLQVCTNGLVLPADAKWTIDSGPIEVAGDPTIEIHVGRRGGPFNYIHIVQVAVSGGANVSAGCGIDLSPQVIVRCIGWTSPKNAVPKAATFGKDFIVLEYEYSSMSVYAAPDPYAIYFFGKLSYAWTPTPEEEHADGTAVFCLTPDANGKLPTNVTVNVVVTDEFGQKAVGSCTLAPLVINVHIDPDKLPLLYKKFHWPPGEPNFRAVIDPADPVIIFKGEKVVFVNNKLFIDGHEVNITAAFQGRYSSSIVAKTLPDSR